MSYCLLLKLLRHFLVCCRVWIYVVLPFAQTSPFDACFRFGLNICRITFCSNSDPELNDIPAVWIYVVLPFAQTYRRVELCPTCLNICRIAFCSNFQCLNVCRITCCSNLRRPAVDAVRVWIYVVLPFSQTGDADMNDLTCLNICRITFWSN